MELKPGYKQTELGVIPGGVGSAESSRIYDHCDWQHAFYFRRKKLW